MSEEIQGINLDDYIQTGEGGTALTYTKKDGLSLAHLDVTYCVIIPRMREEHYQYLLVLVHNCCFV